MEDVTGTSKFSGTPSVIEKSPLDFSNEDPPRAITERGRIEDQVQAEVSNEAPSVENPHTTGVIPIPDREHEAGAMGSLIRKKCRKRGNDEEDANVPPKVLRKDHASIHPKQSTRGGKSLAAIGLEADFTFTSAVQETPVDSPDHQDPHWSCGYNRGIRLVTCGDSGVKEIHNTNLARQVALGSQLRLRFEQEVRLLMKAKSQVAKCNKRIHVKEEEIKRLGEEVESLKAVETEVHGLRNQTKNLKTLLEAEVDMKKATKAKNRVSTLQAQVMGEERIQAAFKEFKKYEDDRVEKHCAKMDACLDAMSLYFDEELYPHMLTAIVGRRWVIGHDLRLAVMKCAESIKLRQT
ncbi:hypothetical protein Tco_1470960, partial [Tanacetum coccineum]